MEAYASKLGCILPATVTEPYNRAADNMVSAEVCDCVLQCPPGETQVIYLLCMKIGKALILTVAVGNTIAIAPRTTF